MAKKNKIDWPVILFSFGFATLIAWLILMVLGTDLPWWAWVIIPVWNLLFAFTLQVMGPTGPPKPWFKK